MSIIKNLIVRAGADFTPLNKGLKDAQKNVKTAGENMRASLKTTATAIAGLGVAFAGVAVVFGKSVLDMTADHEAFAEQYKATFKGMVGEADKWTTETAKTYGLHNTNVQKTLTTYYAILRGKGVEEKKAMELAEQYTLRTADASAYYNKSLEDSTEYMKSFLKGEYDAVDNIGVYTNATQLSAIAVEKYGKKFNELTVEQQETLKAQEALRQHTASGTFDQGIREADSYQNTIAKMKGAWEDIIVTFGKPLLKAVLPQMQKFAQWVSDNMPQIKKTAEETMEKIIDLYKGLADGIKTAIKWFDKLLPVIAGITGAIVAQMVIDALNKLYKAWSTATKTQTTLQWLLNVALNANPLGLVALAIGALIAVGVLLYKNWDTIIKWADKLWEKMKEIFAPLAKWFKDKVIDPINEKWVAFKDKVTDVATDAWDALKKPFVGAYSWFKTNVIDKISSAFSGIKDAFSGSITGGFKKVYNTAVGWLNSMIGSINKIRIPGVWDGVNISKIPALAKGGITNGPTLALIGDNVGGKEVVSPLDKLQGMLLTAVVQGMQMSQPKQSNQNTGNIVLNIDGREFARIIKPFQNIEQNRVGQNIRLNSI